MNTAKKALKGLKAKTETHHQRVNFIKTALALIDLANKFSNTKQYSLVIIAHSKKAPHIRYEGEFIEDMIKGNIPELKGKYLMSTEVLSFKTLDSKFESQASTD